MHIGGQAVSRYHQLKNFPLQMIYHIMTDFTERSYLIQTDGYFLLQNKDYSLSTGKDKCDRDGLTSATGLIFLFNRAVKATSSIEAHVKDIKNIFQKNPDVKKPVLSLLN